MNRALSEIIISVLGFAGDTAPMAERLKRFNLREWETTFSWLDRSGLSLYFWNKAQELGLQDAVPPAIGVGLKGRYARNSARTRTILREWRHLQKLFNSSGVLCVVLKGLAKIPDYCLDPALRVQFDHDWLIDRGSFERVTEVLRLAGYQRKNKPELDRAVYSKNDPPLGGEWDPSDSYDAKLPRSVEIHLDLWDSHNERIPIVLPRNLVSRRAPRKWGNDLFFSLSDEDALVFEALHTFRHIIHNWCRLSLLFELAHFLDRHSSDPSFWRSFCVRIECNLALRRITGVVFTLARTMFNVPDAFGDVPPEFFTQTPELQLWVERYGRRSALSNFSEDKFSLFLLREFVEEGDGWRHVRRRRLFPVQAPHRLPATMKKGAFAGVSEKYRSGIRFIRRLGFHMRGTLLYALEYPRWRFLIRSEKRKLFSQFAQSASQARQTNWLLRRRAYEPPADLGRPLK
jgi:Uncharacterised nucleotidyltransferase